MSEKKYLKWYQKVAYGSGDFAAICSFGLMASFIMIYCTDVMGMNSGVIGTLMLFSKVFDGVTDVICGRLIDRTKSKLGKTRPWMLYSQIGVSGCLVLLFAIPNTSENVQYAYFFIVYTSLNAIFYTANNIAYSTLTALITRNGEERVQLGSIRFIFSLVCNLIITTFAMNIVNGFGGGAVGWRRTAVLFGLIALAVNTFSCLMVKELPEDPKELAEKEQNAEAKNNINFLQSVKYLLSNKYYIIILCMYLTDYITTGIMYGVAIYYMTYILGNASLLGSFTLMRTVPMVIGLSLTPMLLKKVGSMYKLNLAEYSLAFVSRLLFVGAAFLQSVPLMLLTYGLYNLFGSSLKGSMNALIAETSDYTYRRHHVRIDGTMFSCSSVGIKIGSGLGSALLGWFLELGGYVGSAATQTAGAISMIQFLYVIVPTVLALVMIGLLSLLTVEKANRTWDEEHK